MSGIATGWAWKYGPSQRLYKVVLAALADCSDRMGENAYPGVPTLVERTGYSERSIRAALAELEAAGWIEVTAKGGGRGRTTVYRICMERVQPLQGSSGERVQPSRLNPATSRARIEKNGRENARQSHEGCEYCDGDGYTWIEATRSARPCERPPLAVAQ